MRSAWRVLSGLVAAAFPVADAEFAAFSGKLLPPSLSARAAVSGGKSELDWPATAASARFISPSLPPQLSTISPALSALSHGSGSVYDPLSLDAPMHAHASAHQRGRERFDSHGSLESGSGESSGLMGIGTGDDACEGKCSPTGILSSRKRPRRSRSNRSLRSAHQLPVSQSKFGPPWPTINLEAPDAAGSEFLAQSAIFPSVSVSSLPALSSISSTSSAHAGQGLASSDSFSALPSVPSSSAPPSS